MNKMLLVLSLLMAAFVAGTVTVAIMQIVGAAADIDEGK